MSEHPPTDVDALLRRVQVAAEAGPTVTPETSGEGRMGVDDHADALAAALRRCDEAFAELERVESRTAQLARLVGRGRRRSGSVETAMRALRDVVNRLDTRYRHDIKYLLEQLAEVERRSLVADEIANRVERLERSPGGAVVDLAHFAAWFAGTDFVLWVGEAEGPLYQAVASAGAVMVYSAPAAGAEVVVGAAVIAEGAVSAVVVDQVSAILASGGVLAVMLDTPAGLTAVVEEVEKAGFDSRSLTWLADEQLGVAGALVVTFRRQRPR